MVKFLNDTGLTRLVALIKQAINGKADKTELPLVVNFTESNNVVTCDTSIADIYAAFSADREVVGHMSSDGQINLFVCRENVVVFYWIFGDEVNYIIGNTANDVDSWTHIIEYIQEKLTFDNAPTSGSSNPVKSGGIKTAIDAVKQMRIELTSTNNGNTYTANYTYQQILAAYNAGADLSVTIDGNGYPIYHLTNEENGYFCFMGTPYDEINCIQNLHLSTNGTWSKGGSYYSQELTSHLVVNEAPSQTVDPVGELSFGGGTPSLYLKQTQYVECEDNSTSVGGYIMRLKSDNSTSELSGDEYCPVFFRFGKASSGKKGWFAYIPEGYTPRTQPYLSLTKSESGLYSIISSIPIMSMETGTVGLFPRPRYYKDGSYSVPHLSKHKKLRARQDGHSHEQKFRWGIALMKKTDYANMAKPWGKYFDFTKLATNIMPFRVSYRSLETAALAVSIVT